jgi:hypothetical protein
MSLKPAAVPPAPPADAEPESLKETQFQSSLEDMVAEYLKFLPKPQLVIMTPCYGNTCHVPYLNCIVATISLFSQLGISVLLEFCSNDSLVSRARNNLVARAMSNEANTHFMFIDSDIAWNPQDIVRMILANKPLIGGIYPLKKYNWDRMAAGAEGETPGQVLDGWFAAKDKSGFTRQMSAGKYIQSKLLKFNVNYAGNTLRIAQNCAQVKHLPTGFMLIQRDTFMRMMAAHPETKYTDDIGFLTTPEQNKYAYALFDCGVVDNHYYSEDWMFCDRWCKMGGEAFMDVGVSLAHSGQETFEGTIMSSLVR